MSQKLTLILDSTQISSFMNCPRLWHYEHDICIELPEDEDKELMTMGTYGHKLLEVYYRNRAAGRNQSESASLSHQYKIDEDYIGLFHKKQTCNRKLRLIEATTTWRCDFCGVEYDAGDEDNVLKRTSGMPLDELKRREVRDRFDMYTFTYANNDYHIASPEHAEVGFSELIHESADRIYILEGKMDLFQATLNGQLLGFVDHKFQGRRRNIYAKSIQFRNYGMVAGASIAQVNYIRFTKKIDKETFERKPIPFITGEHQWWRKQLIAVYDRVAAALANGSTDPEYWMRDQSNPNWAMCSGLFGYECNYTKLCEIGNPKLVQLTLENAYKKKDMWRPW